MAYNESLAGVGEISIVPSGTYPDPVHVVNIESMDWAYEEDTAELENSDGYVVDQFTTKTSMSGTVSMKDLPNSLVAAAVRGATMADGSLIGYAQTTVVPSSPYTITVTNGATFADNLGVIDLTAGKPIAIAATAVAGVSCTLNTTTGAYTFASGDAGHSMLINYRSTSASTGTTTTVAAAAAAASAYFGLHCYKTINGRPWGLFVPKAKLHGLAGKLSKKAYGDFTVKFTATLDDSGNLAYHYK